MNWVNIGSDNGLTPIRCQAIIWTNAGLLSIGPLGTNLSEILIKIQNFLFTKMRLKIWPATWRSCCTEGELTNVPGLIYGKSTFKNISSNEILMRGFAIRVCNHVAGTAPHFKNQVQQTLYQHLKHLSTHHALTKITSVNNHNFR